MKAFPYIAFQKIYNLINILRIKFYRLGYNKIFGIKDVKGVCMDVDSKCEYKFPYIDVFPHEEIAERRRWILRYAKKGGVGVEFGVFRGHFSVVILREIQPKKLYLVDPWTKLGREYFDWGEKPEKVDYTNFNKLKISEAKQDAEERIKSFGDYAEKSLF